MKAPIPPVSRFQDWDVISSHVRSFLDEVRYPGLAMNEDWLKQLADRVEAVAGWTYDEAKQEFLCHALPLGENVMEYIAVLNVLRALSDFKDTSGDDYAVIPDTPEFREFLAKADAELRKLAFGDEGEPKD